MDKALNETDNQLHERCCIADRRFWRNVGNLIDQFYQQCGVQDEATRVVLIAESFSHVARSGRPLTTRYILDAADRILGRRLDGSGDRTPVRRVSLALRAQSGRQGFLADQSVCFEELPDLQCLPDNVVPMHMPTQHVDFPLASVRTLLSRLFKFVPAVRRQIIHPGDSHVGGPAGSVN